VQATVNNANARGCEIAAAWWLSANAHRWPSANQRRSPRWRRAAFTAAQLHPVGRTRPEPKQFNAVKAWTSPQPTVEKRLPSTAEQS